MITVKLIGGLGNQMFQYAFGRSIAHFKQTALRLDIYAFQTYHLHKYGLNNLSISPDVIISSEQYPEQNIRSKLIQYLLPYYKRNIVVEHGYNYDPNILLASRDAYFDGYWQSEKYFKEIDTIIRNEFQIKRPQTGKNAELGTLIKSCESVSIHIRRGDYVSDLRTNKVHGTCSIDYYYLCIECIAKHVSNPYFFIFSDDFAWATNSLNIQYPHTFVDINTSEQNYEDLRLMSQCKHNIIANSSFSWWGAWLNNNPHKIVIAPWNWFQDKNLGTKDRIPDKWIKL